MKELVIVLSILFSSIVGVGQECSYYHRKNCVNKELRSMTYDSQSKSAILGKGQISEFHMVAYGGLDYRVSICAEEKLGDQIQFRIYEKQRVLVKEEKGNEPEKEVESSEDDYDDSYDDDAYDEGSSANKKEGPKYRMVKELLHDNKDDGFNNMIEFTAEGSMSLIIEVIVPGSGNTSKLKIRELGCVGVLIEHKKSKKVGFN